MNDLKRKNRRLLILLAVVALSFYLGAIYYTGTH